MNAASRRFVAFAVSLSMVLGLMPNVALAQGEGNDAPEVVEQVVLDEEVPLEDEAVIAEDLEAEAPNEVSEDKNELEPADAVAEPVIELEPFRMIVIKSMASW